VRIVVGPKKWIRNEDELIHPGKSFGEEKEKDRILAAALDELNNTIRK